MNEFLFLLTILVSFFGVVVAFRFWGKCGLFVWIGFASILTNIEVVKCVDIFGLPVTLGNVLYGSTFLCTDIISELYGGKESRKAVRMGLFAIIAYMILSQISLLFVPNEEDMCADAMETLFSFAPRICLASVFTYILTNTIDTYLYEWIGKLTKRIWIKNNLSTMTSQLIDSALFTELAFAGTLEQSVVIQLIITMYAFKFIVAVCDTPFIYLAKKIEDTRNYEH